MKEINTYLERRMNEAVYQSSNTMKVFAPWVHIWGGSRLLNTMRKD